MGSGVGWLSLEVSCWVALCCASVPRNVSFGTEAMPCATR